MGNGIIDVSSYWKELNASDLFVVDHEQELRSIFSRS